MRLSEKQQVFTATLGKFLVWCSEQGYNIVLAEVFRTREQAEIYAAQGKGIKNSLHCLKLAADMFRFIDGRPTWNAEDYRVLGDKWKSMHPLARWGGDFKGRDAVHFSFEHNGVR